MILVEKKSINIDENMKNGEFYSFKLKAIDFCLRRKRIKGKEVAEVENLFQNFCQGRKSYIKLHISSVTLGDAIHLTL